MEGKIHVWVVTDENYSHCGESECACSGILGQIFASEQTAKQYAERMGGQVSRQEVRTSLPVWARQ
jgi:hypothetical protein